MLARIRERVGRGAALLDGRLGNDWHRRIARVEELDVGNAYRCVLGQMCGSYCRGLRELGIEDGPADPGELGFGMPHSAEENCLTSAAWRNLIKLRLCEDECRKKPLSVMLRIRLLLRRAA